MGIELLLHLLIIHAIDITLTRSRELAVLTQSPWLIRLKNLTRITLIFTKVIGEDYNRADQKGNDELDEDMNPDWHRCFAYFFDNMLMIIASH